MPVPWPAEATSIAALEDRAITIQQLRDLEVFIQRLCKVGQLTQRDGKRLEWFDINMYDIRDCVIKPLITYVEEQRGTRRRFSWVEFVAAGPQKPQLLFSHSWSGRFRDFMAIVKLVARSDDLATSVPIWVCTFANSQFGEDFGPGLRASPFCKAVQAAQDGTVLVVDRDASSLQRIWCGFELHLTLQGSKPLQVYTSAGKVGTVVTSGRLVDAVERFDVTAMEASEDSDRRQILNFLGGGEAHEKDGLKVDADGNLDLVDGWRKQLADEAVTADAPARQDGRPEFEHEAGLFSRHAESFAKLNNTIRGQVLAAAGAGAGDGPSRGCRIPRLEDRSVTLSQLRSFAKKVRQWCSGQAGLPYEAATIGDVYDRYIRPRCPRTSLAEQWSSRSRIPRYVIDETWQSSFHDTMSAIEWFAEAKRLRDETNLFFTPVCLGSMADAANWEVSIGGLVSNCEGWITVLSDAREESIVRANKMEQLQLCFQKGKSMYLGCKSGVLACTMPFPDSSWTFGDFDPDIARILVHARWEEARCQNEVTEQRIREMVRTSRGGFASFGARVTRVAMGPLLRHAVQLESAGGMADLQALFCRSSFLINSSLLKGCLGETAVHCAAACGNLDCLKVLLDHHADPNAEDDIRETPLHYAAMTGMVGSVQLLLKYGAEPRAESAFAEEAALVAEQSPAAFLGRDTSAVVALLSAWEMASSRAERRHAPEQSMQGACRGPANITSDLNSAAPCL